MQTFLINIKRFFESSLQFFSNFIFGCLIWPLHISMALTMDMEMEMVWYGNGMAWKWNGMEMEMENTSASDKSIHIKISPHLKEKGKNF